MAVRILLDSSAYSHLKRGDRRIVEIDGLALVYLPAEQPPPR